MCPSMSRKLKVIVYFRKVFLLVKIQIFLFTLLTFTLLFCPLHQSGKDLSLLLKLSKVGALTTADGKSFQ